MAAASPVSVRAQALRGDAPAAVAAVEDGAASSTRGALTLEGRRLDYVATAARLDVRDDAGALLGDLFHVDYVAAAAGDVERRPVTFLFNGGPGSSSVWLHMGGLGPVRVRTGAPRPPPGAPFEVGPSADTLLDQSDLVFVDAPETGYSRSPPALLAAQRATDADLDVFARFIARWLTVNGRWSSPKFILGESYGGLRAAGLALRLADDGVQLNGTVIVSPFLDFGRLLPGRDDDRAADLLPALAAAAAYHGRAAVAPSGRAAWLAAVRRWARGPYRTALAEGDDLAPAARRAVAERLARDTGLPLAAVLDANLRVDEARFRRTLLADRGLVLGRYDARVTGAQTPGADGPAFDPSDAYVPGPFTAAFKGYVRRDLGFRTALDYRTFHLPQNVGWDFSHRSAGAPARSPLVDVVPDLAQALRETPRMSVLVAVGDYDLATPAFGTESDLAHLFLPSALRARMALRRYAAGHMIYLDDAALHAFRADLRAFYGAAGAPR